MSDYFFRRNKYEDVISKWHDTGLLDGASDKHKIAMHLQNCHNYLIKSEHCEDIGAQMLRAIRKIYNMDSHIEFHFEILAKEFYDKMVLNHPNNGEYVWNGAACYWEVEIVDMISKAYAKEYVSEYRLENIKKLFFDLEREKNWVERELIINNWIS